MKNLNRLIIELVAAMIALFGGGLVVARFGPKGAQKSAIYEYDFAVDGGAIGNINLRLIGGDGPVPLGAVIDGKNVAIDVLTAPTSGGAATLGLALDAGGDVQTAVVISGVPWSTTGMKDPTLEAPLKSAGGVLKAAVAVAVLTAGKFRVYVSYETLS